MLLPLNLFIVVRRDVIIQTTRMEPWRTAIVDAGPDHLRVRGHDVLELMQRSTFTDLVFLLHHDRVALAWRTSRSSTRSSSASPTMDPVRRRCAAARLAASGNRSIAVGRGGRRCSDDR